MNDAREELADIIGDSIEAGPRKLDYEAIADAILANPDVVLRALGGRLFMTSAYIETWLFSTQPDGFSIPPPPAHVERFESKPAGDAS